MKISIYIDEEKAEKCCYKDRLETLSLLAKELGYTDIEDLIIKSKNYSLEEYIIGNEIKERYVWIIANLLGLPADVTLERITASVMAKTDQFVTQVRLCSTLIQVVKAAFIVLGSESIRDLAENVFNECKEILEMHKNDYTYDGCYSAAKRKYAQEIQYLFFIEGRIKKQKIPEKKK